MIVRILVGFANERPPSDQDYVMVVVGAESEVEAQLIACQMAACHSEMPTSSQVHSIVSI